MHTGFSQYDNFQNQKITMLENKGYITELTAWHCYQGHMNGTHVWRGGNHSHFFWLEHRHTPHYQFRGSIPRTGQTWRGCILILVPQRRANHASLGVLVNTSIMMTKQILFSLYCPFNNLVQHMPHLWSIQAVAHSSWIQKFSIFTDLSFRQLTIVAQQQYIWCCENTTNLKLNL